MGTHLQVLNDLKSKREVEKAKLFSRITGLEQVNAALQIESKKQDDANANGKGKGKGKGKARTTSLCATRAYML